MKTTDCIAFTLTALALIGSAAFAQATSTSTTTATTTATQATSGQTAEQREKARLKAEAEKKVLAAQQQAVERAERDFEEAQRALATLKAEGAASSPAGHEADVERAKRDLRRAGLEMAKVQSEMTRASRELELYAKGTSALDMARYERALEAFAEAAALKGAKADSALYWKAFSEYKVDARRAALESLKQMQKNFPDSRWLEQALALELEVKASMGEPVAPAATPDEELKLLALNGLLHTDSEQALPMLEKMINGPQSVRLKKRALFVVSQSKSPKAREILTSVAKASPDPDLQIEALEYLQILGGAEDKKVLSDIYSVSKDRDVKVRLIDVLFVQGDARTLVDMARKETDPAMRKRIVERLSRMRSKDATDYLLELINK
jgi:tetratricopeptide (TPR) repeat protein